MAELRKAMSKFVNIKKTGIIPEAQISYRSE
jgi:hypothetical protein